ncbi:MAG: DUF2325 domain-containing protein [Phormidesmis sp.]
MLKSLIQPLQLFIKGATGKDRHQKQQLAQQLISLQVAYDRLQESCGTLQQKHDTLQHSIEQLQKRYGSLQRDHGLLQRDRNELNTLFNYADKENKGLDAETSEMRSHIQKIEAEKAALHSKVVFLEHKLGLRAYEPDTPDAQSESLHSPLLTSKSTEPADLSDGDLEAELEAAEFIVDLSEVSLALVGGHETTHREVAEELKKYGLKRCIHVPPHSRESNNRHQIRDKIGNCDLVVTITSYVDHSVSNCVKQLRDTQMLTGEVIRVHCHGKSGVVREVLQYFAT